MNTARSWLLVCALHGVASMLLWWAREGMVDALTWRDEQWLSQPWTLWTSAWVHMNTPHLIANQLALGSLTAFAWVIRPDARCTLAWLLAWPLVQVSLPLWPQIGYSAGLSGVLHAGATILAVHLLLKRMSVPKAQRWGGLLLLGLLLKVVLERGWSYPVVWDAGSNISVVQAAHLSGVVTGLVLGALTAVPLRRPNGRRSKPAPARSAA